MNQHIVAQINTQPRRNEFYLFSVIFTVVNASFMRYAYFYRSINFALNWACNLLKISTKWFIAFKTTGHFITTKQGKQKQPFISYYKRSPPLQLE